MFVESVVLGSAGVVGVPDTGFSSLSRGFFFFFKDVQCRGAAALQALKYAVGNGAPIPEVISQWAEALRQVLLLNVIW